MVSSNVRSYLLQQGVPYYIIEHPRAFTAHDTAVYANIEDKRLAKTIIARIDGEITMLVLHADERINLGRLKESLGAKRVTICSEDEFENLFPDCELGATPPLGELYGMRVVVSESVASDSCITFTAGSHTDLITMEYRDFANMVRPAIGRFACH